MNKLLLGSAAAALMIAPAVAGPIALTVSGYHNTAYMSIDKEAAAGAADFESSNIDQDAEIHFKFKGKMDNGMTVGGQVQLESEGNDASDQIDEHYIYVKGNFGKVTIGSENSAARMLEAGHDKYLGFSQAEDNLVAGVKIGYTQAVHTSITGDAPKLTYVSPKFSGLQVGYSMTPSTKDTKGDAFGLSAEGDGYGEATSYGLRYKGKVGPAKIAVSAGGESVDDTGGTKEDSSIGLNVSYMGFKFSYKDLTREQDAAFDGAAGETEDTFNNIALSYKLNKKLVLGVDMQSDEDKDGNTTYEHTRFGGSYVLGKGAKLSFSSLDADEDDTKSHSITQVALLLKF